MLSYSERSDHAGGFMCVIQPVTSVFFLWWAEETWLKSGLKCYLPPAPPPLFFPCRFKINFETPELLHIFFFAFPAGSGLDGFQHAATHVCCLNPSGLSIVPWSFFPFSKFSSALHEDRGQIKCWGARKQGLVLFTFKTFLAPPAVPCVLFSEGE